MVEAVNFSGKSVFFPPETRVDCFDINSTITLQATPKAGYKFSGWVITGATRATSNQNPYSIKLPATLADTYVTANFTGGTTPPPSTDAMAQAGLDQTVKEGDRVTLDGSKSSYSGGTITSYLWTQISGQPAEQFSGTTSSRPSFTAPYVQEGGSTLVFRLTVTNNNNAKDTDDVSINVQWTGSLKADAGADQSVYAGDTVTLDGSDSEDSEGQSLAYRWAITRAHPSIDTSQISLSNPSDAMTYFTAPDARGWVEFQLTVTNTDGEKATDSVIVSIRNADGGTELIADAGPDQVVATGSNVQLTGSWDSPDAAIPTYQWKQISGPPIRLSGSDEMAPNATREINPTFTAPDVSGNQETVEIQFIVKDANGVTATDNIAVLVDSLAYIRNSKPPVADAGPDQAVIPGDKVTLDGTDSSDPEGKLFSYQWTFTSGPETIVLSDRFSAKPTFVTPSDGSGSATFELVVTDDATKTDTSTVEVSWSNTPPTANAGPDQVVSEGTYPVTLYGSGSDPDDGIASYHWVQLSGPGVTLSDPSADEPTFSAPLIDAASAILTFELTVTDNGGQPSKDQVQITVNNVHTNDAPVANAGDDQQVTEKAEVSLNGSESSDPDGDTLSYQWIQNSGPTVALSDDSSAAPTFTAPSVTSDVILTFTLIVEDDEGLTSRDTVSVTVYPSSVLPVADAGPDQEVDEGAKNIVTLDASGSSDADEGIKSYLWEQQDGIGVVLSNPSAIMPSFEAPKISEKTVVLTFKLTVENYNGVKNTDSVNITVNNKSSNDGGCFISTVAD